MKCQKVRAKKRAEPSPEILGSVQLAFWHLLEDFFHNPYIYIDSLPCSTPKRTFLRAFPPCNLHATEEISLIASLTSCVPLKEKRHQLFGMANHLVLSVVMWFVDQPHHHVSISPSAMTYSQEFGDNKATFACFNASSFDRSLSCTSSMK